MARPRNGHGQGAGAGKQHCLYWLHCHPNHAEREAATSSSSNGASTPLQNKSRPLLLLCDPSALIYWGARGGCWRWEIGCKLKVHLPVVMCTSRYIQADHATHTVPFSSLRVTCHVGWDVFPIDMHVYAYMVLEEVFWTFHAFLMYCTMVLRFSLKSPKCSLFQWSHQYLAVTDTSYLTGCFSEMTSLVQENNTYI